MIRLDHRDPSARRPAEEAGPVMADARGPTLAPPRRAVVVRVETDRPELEIGWLEQF